MAIKLVIIRIDRKIVELVDDIVKARGENRSDFIRRSIRKELARMSYLGEEEKKALEVV